MTVETASAAPRLVRGPLRDIRTRVFDGARWNAYKPRSDDIVVATYPKCGTTWTQRIVGMLTFKSAEPVSLQTITCWPDMRLWGPVEPHIAAAEAMTHRRQFKSHLAYDGLPVYEGMKFVHVARDGRDSAMSYYNHIHGFQPQMIENANAISVADPKFGTPYFDGNPQDPVAFFHDWVVGRMDEGEPYGSFFHVENSYWSARRDSNMLLVHYNDLKENREGEIRRIAKFLEIDVPESVWPSIVEAAGFETMQAQGDRIMPGAEMAWQGGAKTFIYKGTNGRWRDVARPEDLALYDRRVKAEFSPALAAWIEGGRLKAGDPEML